MNNGVVERFYKDASEIVSFLDEQCQASFRSVAEDAFRKSLLLAAASYFEAEIGQVIVDFVAASSRGDERVVAFVKNKAVARQYHTLFDWERRNVNKFLGLFGEAFAKSAKELISKDDVLTKSAEAFMEIGSERNRLVHTNYAEYSMEKTSDEIYSLFHSAMKFLEWLRGALLLSGDCECNSLYHDGD